MYLYLWLFFSLILVIIITCLKSKNSNIENNKNIINYGTLYKNLWKCPVYVNNKIDYTYYSQCEEDKLFFDNFFSKPQILKNGIFVEIGALDGKYSNTLFYERQLGWRGVLIEGLPSNCKELLKKQRNRSEIFCTAVCPYFPRTVEFFDVWGMGGLKENNPFFYKEKNPVKPLINVTCTKIKDIFYNTGITHIDFFSLDVEGGEYMVLDTFDFSIRVHYWVIEFNSNNKKLDDYVIKLMTKNGYKECFIPQMNIRNKCFFDPLYNKNIKKLLQQEKRYYNDYGKPCDN